MLDFLECVQMKGVEGVDAAEPRVLVCLYDLTLWYLQRTNRYPKNWRVTLGDAVDRLLLDMLATAQQARVTPGKAGHLSALSEKLESLRMLTRLGRDLGCLEVNQYEYVAKRLDEIGRQVGGWLKQQRRRGEA